MATFYLNGPSLSSATAVFTDNNLSVCAADAFYSDGIIVREQVDCVLLPTQVCPECSIPCGEPISVSGSQGIYLINLDTGTDVGAIIIRFDPAAVPDGIRATFNSVVYNKLTSPLDGLHQGISNDYTFIGDTAADCGISGETYPSLDEYLYNGTDFISTGNTQSVTVNPGSVSLSASAPGNCMMVIPKSTASPSIINFEMVGPCSGTAWLINVDCPVLLTGFSSSLVAVSSELVCELSLTQTYYNASLEDTPGTVDVYDFVYANNLGSVPLADGFYKATGSIAGGDDWFEVEDGVVISVGTCGELPPENAFCIGVILDSYTCCDAIDAYNNEGCPTAPFPSSAYFYSECSSLSLGCVMYSDAELLYPITDIPRWIYDGTNCWFMDSTGTITEEGTCTPITYDLYLADQYTCEGCTLVATGITVALPTGTTPEYGKYYGSDLDGNSYLLVSTASVGPGLILGIDSYTTCAGSCD
jgi:hypothetical protein